MYHKYLYMKLKRLTANRNVIVLLPMIPPKRARGPR